jgi:decaprenylphospho-beta-D-ribofuranose 2-oxidase
MFPTLGGALAMNIHGKNAFAVGTLGEHVDWIDVMDARGEMHRLTSADPRFRWVISGAGLLGVILGCQVRMKRVTSGNLRVRATSCRNWDEQFDAFEHGRSGADYMVSWIDAFATGQTAGRGLFHSAQYTDDGGAISMGLDRQVLPSRILGFFPKSEAWRFLKLANRRPTMRALNTLKHIGGRTQSGHERIQSLVAFSFLLDYVPSWQRAYDPHGFIQYQSFVPETNAQHVFRTQFEWQQDERLESFLAVMKRHRTDRFGFSHGVDGYSLALDFKVEPGTWPRLQALCDRMNSLVLDAGGRFYFAKDSTLTPGAVEQWIGEKGLAEFRSVKQEFDPEGLFSSALAERVGLIGRP